MLTKKFINDSCLSLALGRTLLKSFGNILWRRHFAFQCVLCEYSWLETFSHVTGWKGGRGRLLRFLWMDLGSLFRELAKSNCEIFPLWLATTFSCILLALVATGWNIWLVMSELCNSPVGWPRARSFKRFCDAPGVGLTRGYPGSIRPLFKLWTTLKVHLHEIFLDRFFALIKHT